MERKRTNGRDGYYAPGPSEMAVDRDRDERIESETEREREMLQPR